jgi:hypothetical protein
MRSFVILIALMLQTEYALAQTTRPTASEISKAAALYPLTPDEFKDFLQLQIGEPILVDGDLIVGVKRDSQGHVKSLAVYTADRNVHFARHADSENAGLRYSTTYGDKPPAQLFNAADIDGDGRIDLLMSTDQASHEFNVFICVANEIVRVKSVRGGFASSDGRRFTFDPAKHDFLEEKRHVPTSGPAD